jgi:hypothetical protein
MPSPRPPPQDGRRGRVGMERPIDRAKAQISISLIKP